MKKRERLGGLWGSLCCGGARHKCDTWVSLSLWCSTESAALCSQRTRGRWSCTHHTRCSTCATWSWTQQAQLEPRASGALSTRQQSYGGGWTRGSSSSRWGGSALLLCVSSTTTVLVRASCVLAAMYVSMTPDVIFSAIILLSSYFLSLILCILRLYMYISI